MKNAIIIMMALFIKKMGYISARSAKKRRKVKVHSMINNQNYALYALCWFGSTFSQAMGVNM